MPAYLLRAHPDDLKRMCLLQVIEEGHITNQVVIGCGYSNYVHDGTMTATADLSVPCDEVFAKPSVFMGTNVQERLEALGWTEQELDVLLQAVLEWARSKARELYRNLEKEYEYQTSDEYIAETCEVNEYVFDEDGTMQ